MAVLAPLGMVTGAYLSLQLFSRKSDLRFTRQQVRVLVLTVLFSLATSLLFLVKGGKIKAIFMLVSCCGAIIVGLSAPLANRRLSSLMMLVVLGHQLIVFIHGVKSLVANNWWLPAFNVYFSSTNGTAQFAAVSMAIVLLIYSVCKQKEGFIKQVFMLNLVMGTAIIMLSASRGGILALFFGASYWLWKSGFRTVVFNKTVYKYIAGASLLVILVSISIPSVHQQLTSYYYSINKVQSAHFLKSEGRTQLLVEAVKQIHSDSESFWLGQNELFADVPNTRHFHAHNSFIELVRNLGILPLLLLVLLLVVAVMSPRGSPYVMAALIIILVRSCFDDTLLWSNFGEFFLLWPTMLLTYRYGLHFENNAGQKKRYKVFGNEF